MRPPTRIRACLPSPPLSCRSDSRVECFTHVPVSRLFCGDTSTRLDSPNGLRLHFKTVYENESRDQRKNEAVREWRHERKNRAALKGPEFRSRDSASINNGRECKGPDKDHMTCRGIVLTYKADCAEVHVARDWSN